MRSKSRREEAFNYWVDLGDRRSYRDVSNQLSIPKTTIDRWAKQDNWKERLEKVEDKVDADLNSYFEHIIGSEFKSAVVDMTQKKLDIVNQLLEQFHADVQSGAIRIKSVRDLEILVKLSDSLSEKMQQGDAILDASSHVEERGVLIMARLESGDDNEDDNSENGGGQ